MSTLSCFTLVTLLTITSQWRKYTSSEGSLPFKPQPLEYSPTLSDIGRSKNLPGLLRWLLISPSWWYIPGSLPSLNLHQGNYFHFSLNILKHRRQAFALYCIFFDLLFPKSPPTTPFSCSHMFKRKQDNYYNINFIQF